MQGRDGLHDRGGAIVVKNRDGEPIPHSYCDVWRFRDGRMAELKAFVIPDTAE
jgi:ketosteroid isomerase-like protein